MINTILNLLRSDGYITVNKTLACNIGLAPATIFSELASKFNYFNTRNELREGYFYCTIPDLQKNTGLKKDEQDTAINKLINFGLIEKKVKKLKGDEAPKRYFKIVDDVSVLLKHLKSVEDNGFSENPKSNILNSVFDNVNSSPNKNNNIIINNNQSVSPEKTDRPTDELNNIFNQAQIELYEPNIQILIKEVITELYTKPEMAYILKMGFTYQEIQEKIKKLEYIHVDRAIHKLNEAQEQKGVTNIKIYFCKALLSAISETGLANLYLAQ